MKQYTGTKTLQAEPMTYGEAHERGLIRENAYVEEYSDNKGYHVVYPDGYESWSPADTFEADQFVIVGTGHSLRSNTPPQEYCYLGSVHNDDQALAFHVFEKK